MHLRSLTCSVDLQKIEDPAYQAQFSEQLGLLTQKVAQKYSMRTRRINTIPLGTEVLADETALKRKVRALSEFCKSQEIRWFCIAIQLSEAKPTEIEQLSDLAVSLVGSYQNCFVNLITPDHGFEKETAMSAARAIKAISALSPNGIDNFRFGVSCNVAANTPFFPFSFASAPEGFAIAVESTVVLSGSSKTANMKQPTDMATAVANDCLDHFQQIEQYCQSLEAELGWKYFGQDISISPFPDENISVLDLADQFGLSSFGAGGTLFTTSVLTGLLKSILADGSLRAVGFNGVMYSLLEDKRLCQLHDNRSFDIQSLLHFSSVCGCGVDMVPLPGDVSEQELSAIIMDTWAMATRLGKPLGVRVLPIPGAKIGDLTDLELDFLTNTKIADSLGYGLGSN